MADRDDPRPLLRPLSEQTAAPPTAAGEDPLAELVRIMSAQLIADATPDTDRKTVPVIGVISSEVAFANDLQIKLLDDLKSLSSSFYSHPPPQPVTAPSAPPAKPPAPVPKPAVVTSQPTPHPAASATSTLISAQPAAAPVARVEKPALGRERPAIAVPSRSEKPESAVPLPPGKRQAPGASPADRPPVVLPLTDTPEKAEKEKPELAKAVLRPTAVPPAAADAATVRPSGDRENRAVKSPAAPDPGRFPPTAHLAPFFRPKAAQPHGDELPKMAPSSGISLMEEEVAPPEDLETQALYAEDDGELPPLHDEIEEFRQPRRSLFIGGAFLAVMLAAGVTYVMMQSEKSVAMPPTIAGDPTNMLHDGVDGVQSIHQTKLVTPGNEKVAEVPASSGDDSNPISRVIEPAGPGFDAPAKVGDAPADHPATDAAAGDKNGQTLPSKVPTFGAGPDIPAASSAAASDEAASKPPPGASPAALPSATPAADNNGADARLRISARETAMDEVLNGTGSPIPVNVDPLGINGGGNKAAGASPGADRAPEPGGSASATGDAALAPGQGAAAADKTLAVPAAPARVPIPPTRPIVVPNKSGNPFLPTVASRSSTLY